jgi:hypothetical protein
VAGTGDDERRALAEYGSDDEPSEPLFGTGHRRPQTGSSPIRFL